ncbi:MAG: amidase [Rhodospirillaceae bacterium]|nr:amidase [Rhodospirillaceae bacterium]
MDELLKRTATDVVGMLRKKEVSPVELIEASLARIEAVEPQVNALPTVCADRALDRARSMRHPAEPGPGYLWGLPVVIKDLADVEGVRTTYGSPIYADNKPVRSDLVVQTLEKNGAIVLAKSNTPEFGAGSQTFNEVFGTTRNPWNLSKTVGGSSGGGAAALATGEAWIATGSDLGGSLRNPAAYCSVVGLRPSAGRVAHGPSGLPFDMLPVDGPMARTVGDVALMLDAMVGQHPHDPLSLMPPAEPFQAALSAPERPLRVAFSPDLGIAPVEPEVIEICAAAARKFETLGATVEEACPDLTGAAEVFHTLRAYLFATGKEALLEHRDQLKPEVIWNIEAGLNLSIAELSEAERQRGVLAERMATFLDDYDLLLCPAAILPPFDATMRYPENVAGVHFDSYIGWLIICAAITLTGAPAMSVPCGFTKDGLPIGLQIVGKPRGEAALLAAAARFEGATGLAQGVPIDPRPGKAAA